MARINYPINRSKIFAFCAYRLISNIIFRIFLLVFLVAELPLLLRIFTKKNRDSFCCIKIARNPYVCYLLYLHMRIRKLLPLVSLIVLAGCTKIKEPQFRGIDNFRLKNFGLQEAVIAFNVTYYNPNNFGVTVKEAGADVYLDTIYLGKFVQDSTIAVKKNADFSIPLSGSVSFQTVLNLNFQELSQREVLLKANGSVKVGKAGIFITKPFSYLGKHRLEDISFHR
jgi:LEA14-like dessication related protein